MICVIFGGADMGDDTQVKIPENAYVIAADSGYRHCLRYGVKPDLILGDFDSYEDRLPDDCEIFRAPREKDDTDLMLAVKTGFEKGCRTFYIYGADGGRMGHTVAAVQTLAYIESNGGEGVLFGNGFAMRVYGEGTVKLRRNGAKYLSVFALTESAEITEKNLKYSGDLKLTYDFPLGVSNEFIDDRAEIEVRTGKILVILEK